MPYDDLPAAAFWKRCLEDGSHHLNALYAPKFTLRPGMRVAAAGSCFAQYFRQYVPRSDLAFVDMEPPPRKMSRDVARQFGYGMFSARFGNIYSARQLSQLFQDTQTGAVHDCAIWESGGRFIDGLRPRVEPAGFAARDELHLHRLAHLNRVRAMLEQTDVFVFTLGLTEAWRHRASGTVFPMAPGTVAGRFDPQVHEFVNFTVTDVLHDLRSAMTIGRAINPDLRFLLTVSPVPLTATASGQHVIQATTYSKSVLRAAAGQLAQENDFVDYFPSYEIITSPLFGSQFFEPNMRSVTDLGVATVMGTFFGAHPMVTYAPGPTDIHLSCETGSGDQAKDELVCEDVLLQEFAPK